MKGKIVTGTGRGAKFIALPIYFQIFKEELLENPFCGTLNLKLAKEDRPAVNAIFEHGKTYLDLEFEGKKMGDIIVIRLKIGDNGRSVNCVGVRPKLTSHDQSILEVVARDNIRELWGVKDGDEIEIMLSY